MPSLSTQRVSVLEEGFAGPSRQVGRLLRLQRTGRSAHGPRETKKKHPNKSLRRIQILGNFEGRLLSG